MKKFITLSILFLISVSIIAQKEYLQKNKNYSLARIYQKDNRILKVNNLKLINDTVVSFKVVGTQQISELNVDDVKYVSVKKGSHALVGGLIGAGSGLLGSLLGVAQVKADPTLNGSEVKTAPIVIGITAGFGAIGAIIGALSPKWKRLYFKDSDLASHIFVYPSFQKNTVGIGLTFTF